MEKIFCHGEILSWCLKTSDSLDAAVIFDDGENQTKISYTEFFNAGTLVSKKLLSQGCKGGSVIACILKNNVWTSSIIFGILNCKACFTFYSENQSFSSETFRQRHVRFVITDNRQFTVSENSSFSTSFTVGDAQFFVFSLCNLDSDIWSPGYPLAYIIETSGTTGEPTIVHVPEKSIVPNIEHLESLFSVTSSDVILLSSPLTFDPSLIDLFLSIKCRATLLILPEKVKRVPHKLCQMLLKHKVSILQCTPSLILQIDGKVLKKELFGSHSNLRIVAFGGEQCPQAHILKEWKDTKNEVLFFNLYGITELSVWAMYHQILSRDLQNPQNFIPLGAPFIGTEINIQDDHGAPVKLGCGTLYVGSQSRICYLNDENPSTLNKVQHAVMRNTGDLVRIDENGRLFYVGRADDQIKYHGKKFNLSEFEISVSSVVTHSAAVWDNRSQHVILACVPKSEVVTKSILLSHVRDIQLPSNILVIPILPVTQNGKVDKLKVMELFRAKREVNSELNHSSTFTEAIFLQKWSDFTGHTPASTTSNFILSGGDSIKAIQLASEMEFDCGRTFPNLVDILLNNSFDNALKYICFNSTTTHVQTLVASTNNPSNDPTWLGQHIANACFVAISRNGMQAFCNDDSLGTECCQFCQECLQRVSRPSYNSKKGLNLSVKWRYDLKKCVDASIFIVCSRSCLVGFIGSHSGIFVALNLTSGECIWKTNLSGRIESSACISKCGRFILVGCYNHCLYCLCSYTGNFMWKFATSGEVKSSPCINSNAGIVYVGSHDQHVYALDLQSGKCSWKQKVGNGSIFASPAISNSGDILIAASLDGVLAAFNSMTGVIIWKKFIGHPLFSSPMLTDNGICIGCVDHFVYFYDFRGVKLWSYKTNGSIFGSAFLSSCSSANSEYLLIGSHDKNLYSLNKSNGMLAWKYKMDDAIYSTPFTNGDVVVACSSSGKLSLVSLINRNELSTYFLSRKIFSSPVLVADMVVVGCRDNYVYAIEISSNE